MAQAKDKSEQVNKLVNKANSSASSKLYPVGSWREILSRRTVWVQTLLTSFLLGLLLARFGWVTHWQLLLASLPGLVLLLRKSPFTVLALLIIGLNFGLLRGQATLASFVPLTELIGQKVTIIGVIQDDPGATDRYQTEFRLGDLVRIDGGQPEDLAGRILVRGFPGTTLSRGAVVEVSGKVYPPFGNIRAQIGFAEIELLANDATPIEQLRREFFAGARTALPEPQASLGLGFLVGLRTLLPDSLLDSLSRTGLTHIVAVSGYNLTILVRLTRRLLAKYSKYLATAAAVFLILGFLAVTGVSPSIFRAAVVSGFSLAAWYYGYPIAPTMVLMLSAAITAGINPTYLWQDIGWYLSFAAFYGVLVLAPTLTARLYKKGRRPGIITQTVLETLCAQIMALPIIMLIFGELSLISLPANVLILPFIPLAMLLTFIAAAAGMLVPALAGWFAWPANLLLTAMTGLVDWFSAIPWAATELFISPWQLVAIYAVVLIFLLALRKQAKGKLDPYQTVVD